MLMKYESGSSKIFLYFHANAEDLGRAEKFLRYVHTYLRMHVLAVEYPNYGVYPSSTPASADTVLTDSTHVLSFLTKHLLWKQEDLVLCGRSIGSGPATYLASLHPSLSSLVLISPHTSIRGVVKDQFLGAFAQYAIKERFRNLDAIARV